MNLTKELIQKIYGRLYEEYRMLDQGALDLASPPKQAVDAAPGLARGIMFRPLAAMVAKLSCGTAGVKAVLLDENTGDLTAYTSIFYPDGRHKVIEGGDLTRLRCALMAALAAAGRVNIDKNTRVGFLGCGRINVLTAQVFNALWGVEKFVVAGAEGRDVPRERLIEMGEFGQVVVDRREHGFPNMNKCEIVIAATTAMEKKDALNYWELKGPKLFIAQDGGYIFGPTFRYMCWSFSDSPTQLIGHWENEFPWDDPYHGAFNIQNLNKLPPSDAGAQAVYLYGLALGDVVVASEDWSNHEVNDRKERPETGSPSI